MPKSWQRCSTNMSHSSKRRRVEQQIEALARGQLALGVLRVDALLAAAEARRQRACRRVRWMMSCMRGLPDGLFVFRGGLGRDSSPRAVPDWTWMTILRHPGALAGPSDCRASILPRAGKQALGCHGRRRWPAATASSVAGSSAPTPRCARKRRAAVRRSMSTSRRAPAGGGGRRTRRSLASCRGSAATSLQNVAMPVAAERARQREHRRLPVG